MKFIIKNVKPISFSDEDNKNISLNGYAFMDEHDHCIKIVYGEGKRDMMIKHLTNDTNELGIKYYYINLN